MEAKLSERHHHSSSSHRSHGHHHKRNSRKHNDDGLVPEWSRHEVNELKRALLDLPSSLEKQERWRQIAARVGRGKRECYEKFKELKEKKLKRKEAEEAASYHERNESLSPEPRPACAESKHSSAEEAHTDSLSSQRDAKAQVFDRFQDMKVSSGAMLVEECEDFFEEDTDLTSHPNSQPASTSKSYTRVRREVHRKQQKRPIEEEEARAIQRLLFGDRRPIFSDSWTNQGFHFCKLDGLGYGLVQNEGGPCGVVASANGFILSHFMSSFPQSWRSPTTDMQDECLVCGLAEMIWRASNEMEACVCIARSSSHLSRHSHFTPDGVTDRLQLVYGLRSLEAVESVIDEHLHFFKSMRGLGAICFLCSAILSRGTPRVTHDMDAGFTGEIRTLLDHHSYLSQEGVNLLLTGKATSNVFDGVKELSDDVQGTKVPSLAQGVQSKGKVGFLTIHEAYNYLQVGDCLKNPETPVWIVYSESHYSVMFAPDGGASKEEADVIYWDMLANQTEEIQLSVRANTAHEVLPDPNDDSERSRSPSISSFELGGLGCWLIGMATSLIL